MEPNIVTIGQHTQFVQAVCLVQLDPSGNPIDPVTGMLWPNDVATLGGYTQHIKAVALFSLGEDGQPYQMAVLTLAQLLALPEMQAAAGPKGDKGDKGDTGNTGATGATGLQGIQGIPGVSFNVAPPVVSSQSLNTTFQPRADGPSMVNIMGSLASALSLGVNMSVQWSATSGGTYVEVGTANLITLATVLGTAKETLTVLVPTGYWLKVQATGGTPTLTKAVWNL